MRTSYGKPSTRAAQALTGGHLQGRLAGTCVSVAVLDRPFDGQQNSREPTEVEIPPGTKDHWEHTGAAVRPVANCFPVHTTVTSPPVS